jgi:hypothetical protein
MPRLDWQRAQSRVTKREVQRKARDLDSWLREYGIGPRHEPRAKRPPVRVAPSLVKLSGHWCAVIPHNDNAAPAVGDVVECTHAETGRAGQVRVTGTVWTQGKRSLVRVERV